MACLLEQAADGTYELVDILTLDEEEETDQQQEDPSAEDDAADAADVETGGNGANDGAVAAGRTPLRAARSWSDVVSTHDSAVDLIDGALLTVGCFTSIDIGWICTSTVHEAHTCQLQLVSRLTSMCTDI